MSLPLPSADLDQVLDHTRALWEDFRGESVFLTGGTGFVGTWLLETLLWATDRLALGSRVVMLTRDPERFRLTAPHVARHPAVQLVGGDLATFAFPPGRFPFLIHAATEPALQPDAAGAIAAWDSELQGARRVLAFAQASGVRKFLFTSSGAVYGRQPEEMSLVVEPYAGAPMTTDIRSGYGHAKRALESMITMHGEAGRFDALIARLFAFVGPRLPLNAHYAIGNFISDALCERPIRITGDGTAVRSYLYAADLAIWLWTILLRGRTAHPYNVGSSREITIADLAQVVADILAPGTAVEIGAKRTDGALSQRYVPSVERASQELGLRAVVDLSDGIQRTADWNRAVN